MKAPNSNLLCQVTAAVNDTPHFHDIPNHYIENRIAFHLDAVIGVPPFLHRMVWRERFCEGQPLLDRLLDRIYERLRRDRISQTVDHVVYDLVEIILKQRQDLQSILLSVHGYAATLS